LGGHPLKTKGVESYKGTLHITNDNRIIYYEYEKQLFEIKIKDIEDCSIETKSSLSATRVALIGLLAFALKKNKKYIRISFNHKLGKKEVVFDNENNNTEEIIAKINQKRMKLIG
jgi:hypothetical protein